MTAVNVAKVQPGSSVVVIGCGGVGLNVIQAARLCGAAVIVAEDELRSVQGLAEAITFKYNNAAFQRVIYSESHDEVANGKARVPHEIDPLDPTGYFAQKRSTLAAAMRRLSAATATISA